MIQPDRDHLQQLLNHLGVGDVVAEGAEVGGERGDPETELGDGLPSLKEMLPSSRRSCCALASRARSSPIRRILTASHASLAVFFVARVLHNSEGTERKRPAIA